MNELEERLRGLEPPLSEPPSVTELGQRAQRRRRRRRTWAATATTLLLVAFVAGLVNLLPTDPLRIVLDEGDSAGEPADPPADGVDAPGAFVPAARTEGDATVVPVAFPDGSTGELVYPTGLALVDEGVTPHLRVRLASDDPARPSPRARRSLEFHRGPLKEVLTDVNGGRRPERVATYGDNVALWDMDDTTLDRDYLGLQIGGWSVLVPDRIHSDGQTRTLTEAQRQRYATHIGGRENADGFPVLDLQTPVERFGDAALLLGPPDQALARIREPGATPTGPLVRVAASGCLEDQERRGWCQPDAQISFAAWGDEAFVDEVRAGLAMRDVSLAAGIVDDTWASADERAAWERAHGEAAWVPGLFYPPEADVYGSNTDPDDLVVRWHRIADEPLDLDDTDRTRRAFEALQGPPPPGLATALHSVPMQVRATTSDDGVVTINFDDAIVRPTSLGSSAGIATATQIKAQVRHLYSDAHTLCILIDGNGGLDEPGPFLFHEAEGCPMPLTTDSPYAHEPHNGT